MRKLRGGTSVGGMGSSGTSGSDDPAGSTNSQHTALGLMHLKKLFSEYTHPPHPPSNTERNDKLYNMLPLFCKVSVYGPRESGRETLRRLNVRCARRYSDLVQREI